MSTHLPGEQGEADGEIALSIVVAASDDWRAVERCLQSLQGQAQAASAEIIVAANFEVEAARQNVFPDVRFLTFTRTTTVPQLRARGIQQTCGEVVALLEDNVVADGNWCRALREAHRSSHDVIGGAVENTGGSALDWAVYFYDYGKYMLPASGLTMDALAGNNVSYKRRVLPEIGALSDQAFYEAFAHRELIRRGHLLHFAPGAVVYHRKHYEWRPMMAQGYHHGRAFAAMRIEGSARATRLFFAVGSLLLPLLLPARVARGVWNKKRHRRQLVRAFPCLQLLMAAWSWGEMCGYWRGAGNSAGQWR